MPLVFEAEPQALDTGRFGIIHVVQTWVMGDKKISKLSNDAYVHTTGLPITSKKEITEVIPPGPSQDMALYWFDHRDETTEDPGRRITMNPDGSFAFDDGSPIASIAEITQALTPGPHQEVVIRWFIREQDKKAQAQTKQKPEWQKPEQEAMAPETLVKAPKKNIKKKPAAPPKVGEGQSEAPLTV